VRSKKSCELQGAEQGLRHDDVLQFESASAALAAAGYWASQLVKQACVVQARMHSLKSKTSGELTNALSCGQHIDF